ncbi:unnamed protein product [Symbiodinium natans]|uniref:Uncharacterized protein n=2 Tax=Symbiodiniaceae TaxID=252141 RepID=A0A812LLR4_9DINO|nr:unnamed protein product [Symbiodinium natans]
MLERPPFLHLASASAGPFDALERAWATQQRCRSTPQLPWPELRSDLATLAQSLVHFGRVDFRLHRRLHDAAERAARVGATPAEENARYASIRECNLGLTSLMTVDVLLLTDHLPDEWMAYSTERACAAFRFPWREMVLGSGWQLFALMSGVHRGWRSRLGSIVPSPADVVDLMAPDDVGDAATRRADEAIKWAVTSLASAIADEGSGRGDIQHLLETARKVQKRLLHEFVGDAEPLCSRSVSGPWPLWRALHEAEEAVSQRLQHLFGSRALSSASASTVLAAMHAPPTARLVISRLREEFCEPQGRLERFLRSLRGAGYAPKSLTVDVGAYCPERAAEAEVAECFTAAFLQTFGCELDGVLALEASFFNAAETLSALENVLPLSCVAAVELRQHAIGAQRGTARFSGAGGALSIEVPGATRPPPSHEEYMLRDPDTGQLQVVASCLAMILGHAGCLLFANVSSGSLRTGVAMQAETEEGLIIKPEEAGKITSRDKNNNPPRIVVKTNDWDIPEYQLSTGASNQVSYITPVVESEDIKAWLSLNVNFFSIIILFTVGGLIEIQRFFPDTLYW